MRISDWSSDVCSSDLNAVLDVVLADGFLDRVDRLGRYFWDRLTRLVQRRGTVFRAVRGAGLMLGLKCAVPNGEVVARLRQEGLLTVGADENTIRLLPPLTIDETHIDEAIRSEEHTSELQSLMRNSYAVFC